MQPLVSVHYVEKEEQMEKQEQMEVPVPQHGFLPPPARFNWQQKSPKHKLALKEDAFLFVFRKRIFL